MHKIAEIDNIQYNNTNILQTPGTMKSNINNQKKKKKKKNKRKNKGINIVW